MHFHVLGAGSIGSLVSFHLRRALPSEHTVTIIRRTQKIAARSPDAISIENNGVVATQDGFRLETFDGRQSSNPEQGVHPINSLLVTTKAHQCTGALYRLLPRLSAKSTIVLLHNGMGVYEELIRNVFRNPEQQPHFILASVSHGVFRKRESLYVHAGVGEVSFGIVPDPLGRRFEAGFEGPAQDRQLRLHDITPIIDDPLHEHYASLRYTVAALLRLNALNVFWKPISETQTIMRRKLVVNAVVNPLTALMGCRNGDIFGTEPSKRILKRVCGEASSAFAAEVQAEFEARKESLAARGINTENMLMGGLPPGLSRTSLEEEVLRVANVTRGNISSMLSDIRLGRTTEVDFINGYLLRLGDAYRVPMPATATLLNLVKMREAIPLDQMLEPAG